VILFYGFAVSALATAAFGAILAGGQALQLTRLSLPYLLGSALTPRQQRAAALGHLLHLAIGTVFSLFYLAAFVGLGGASVWSGAAGGALHAAVVLLVGAPVLPALHLGMASEAGGATERRRIEPPGPLALHYGAGTPVVLFAAHLAYGGILGLLYS
jgi:hypothetical protein